MKVTIKFGPANEVTREFPSGTTVGQVLNQNVLACIGAGSNVQPLISRRQVPRDTQLVSDTVIELETVANSKAADIRVTVRFGPANEVSRTYPEGTTVGALLRDRSLLATLGAGANVKALIDRAEQGPDTQLADGDVVELETVANSKAA
jgi:sulfur carrier protein ThiS